MVWISKPIVLDSETLFVEFRDHIFGLRNPFVLGIRTRYLASDTRLFGF